MQINFNQALSVGLLFTAVLGSSQLAASAGLLNLLDDEDENGSPTAHGQSVNSVNKDDSPSVIKSTPKLDISGISSTFSELMHDEFPRDGSDRQIANARKNIEKGEKMMQSCGDHHDKPQYKKGKVMKEIGEKSLAALKADGRSTSDSSPELDGAAKTKEIPDSL